MIPMSKLMAAALIVMGAAGCAANAGHVDSAGNPIVGGAPMFASKNIVENAVNSADHTTLVAAVQAAGLADALQGPGPFTVFAPTNAAFDALPPGAVDTLLMPENKAALQGVLTYHVLPVAALSDAVNQMIADDGGAHPAATLSGAMITLGRDAQGRITVTDATGRVATVTIADVRQSNGVIHVIDTVLLPQ